MKRIILTLVLVALSGPLAAQQALKLSADQARMDVTPALMQWREVTVDERSHPRAQDLNSKLAQATQSSWEPLGDGANKGYIEDAYWYRLKLDNPFDTSLFRYLELAYPLIDYVDVFVVQDNKSVHDSEPAIEHRVTAHYSTGDNRPFNSRPVQSRTFVFPLTLEPNASYSIYLRAQSAGAHQVPLRLWASEAFIQHSNTDATIRAVYYGSQLMLIVFMLGLFLLMRERVYLFFSASLIGLLTLQGSLHGVIFQYLVPSMPTLNEYVVLMSVPFTLAMMTLFTSDYLQLRKLSLRWYKLLRMATWVSLAALLSIFILPYQSATVLGLGLSVPLSILMIWAGLASWSSGSRTARLFTLSWVVLLSGCLILIAGQFGTVSLPQISQYAVPFASSIQTLLLAYALANRFQQDRNDKVKAQEARIEALQKQRDIERSLVISASRHHVTGLCNRQIFEHKLKQYLSAEGQPRLAVMLFHLTGVGDLNKTLGHENADDLIKRLAKRLNSAAKNVPHVIPLDRADELLVSNIETTTFGCISQGLEQHQLLATAAQLSSSLQAPIGCMGLSLELSVQTGCAVANHDTDVSTLLRQAFIAFGHSSPHNDEVMMYESGMDAYNPRRLTLMTELKKSLQNDELELFFQPQINLATNQVAGFEALARWTHPEFGFVPPDEFIPIAERTGQIHSLTLWAVEKALNFAQDLHAQGQPLNVSVNISAEDLNTTDFPQKVARLLEGSQVPAHMLTLEVTETAAMRNPDLAIQALTSLAKLGTRISIDDFGSGYSSLTYLRKLTAHEVKIDRSFVLEAHQSADAETIIRTIINMSHELGFKVVGEGVENQAMVDLLHSRGCDIGQGYFYSRPYPKAQIMEWLKQWSAPRTSNINMEHK